MVSNREERILLQLSHDLSVLIPPKGSVKLAGGEIDLLSPIHHVDVYRGCIVQGTISV